MDIFRSFDKTESIKNSLQSVALTFGNFDGVHLGHQTIFEKLSSYPIRLIVTFDLPYLKRLTSTHQKLSIFSEMNFFTACYLIPFTQKLSKMSYEDFLILLKEKTHFSHLFLGEDAAFGHHREGTKEKVFDLENKLSFTFFPVLLKKDGEGKIISSSSIRSFCEQKEFQKCFDAMGRPLTYLLDHYIEKTDHIIFNLESYCLPPSGFYHMKLFTKEGLYIKEVVAKIENAKIKIDKKNLPNQKKPFFRIIPIKQIDQENLFLLN